MVIHNGYDDYWKLDTYLDIKKAALYEQCKAAGYTDLKRSDQKKLYVKALQRCSRNLLRYQSCSDEELPKFATARGVRSHISHPRIDASWIRPRAIAYLEAADEDPKFHKFLDLPPELRCLIYEHHVLAFPEFIETPMRPPMARTCRLVRQEILPIFFANTGFVINIRQGKGTDFKEDNMTKLWLLTLQSHEIHCIHILRLIVHVREEADNPHSRIEKIHCTFELRAKLRYCIGYNLGPNPVRRFWPESMLEHEFQRDTIMFHDALPVVDGSRRRFSLEEIHKLRGIVEGTRKPST